VDKKKSLSNKLWKEKLVDQNKIDKLSQQRSISQVFSKLLISRNIDENNLDQFLNPDLTSDIPNPFDLKDMKKAVDRGVIALINNEKIGIIADYDVDGSTSASILYRFLNHFTSKIIYKIPNRLSEGYGPNLRIMNEMLKEEVKLIFTLDCGTSAFNTIDHEDYKDIDVIVIDHHLSEYKLPKVFSIVNPNRFDDNSNYKDFAAVGVTFLYLMALRKVMRDNKLFTKIKEPNLITYLDLVAVGTICDIVNVTNYNRLLVRKGLELIIQRRNKSISSIIDNTKINSIPSSKDIGFVVGPQINAASRIDDSSLASRLLITNDENEIQTISRKLFLINEKRKLIEETIFREAIEQIDEQKNNNYYLVFKSNWHHGVLGIVASKIVNLYNKPTFVLSFTNNVGTGSGRSIDTVDIGNIILELKKNNLIMEGGGHKMAVGLKLNFNQMIGFRNYLDKKFSTFDKNIFEKVIYYDSIISVNQINSEFISILEQLEPYGKGNEEPLFLIKDIFIDKIKVLKNKHFLVFFKNDLGKNLKGISFNSHNTVFGEYILKYKNYKFHFICTIKRDNFNDNGFPQLQIIDGKLIN
tara:strand:+ start:610 stop:2355 length:1746 start_codon:yes stop_codon:yes gene_type:complete